MTDEQLPRIVLEPTQDTTSPASQSVPLQPVPQKGSDELKKRQAELQAQLDAIHQDESGLLDNVKEWVTRLQGDETKEQALQRELFELTNEITASEQVPAGPSKEELEKNLREAEGALKMLLMQQKIEEKKAFDNYAAGGMKREELLVAMEKINSQFDEQVAQARTKVAAVQQQLSGEPVIAETPAVEPKPVEPTIATTQDPSHIVQALSTLGDALSTEQQQVLQLNSSSIARSKDGNGIVIGGVQFFDADLIRAGLGSDDILSLPNE